VLIIAADDHKLQDKFAIISGEITDSRPSPAVLELCLLMLHCFINRKRFLTHYSDTLYLPMLYSACICMVGVLLVHHCLSKENTYTPFQWFYGCYLYLLLVIVMLLQSQSQHRQLHPLCISYLAAFYRVGKKTEQFLPVK